MNVRVLLLLGALSPSFMARASAQVSFESTQSHRQVVELTGETTVFLESSLPDSGVVIRRDDVSNVILEVTGTFSIVRYPRHS